MSADRDTMERPEWLGDGITMEMIDAGISEFTVATLEHGSRSAMTTKLRHVLSRVWRAMEKARPK